MFEDAIKGTECRLNASKDLDYLLASLQQFNGRNVLGLVVFANPFTKKCIKLIKEFDDLFTFNRLPIIVISDQATDLYDAGYLKVHHSDLYLLNSEDNSISDIELDAIFTILVASTDDIYDLSVIPAERKERDNIKTKGERKELTMSKELIDLFDYLNKGELDENNNSGRRTSISAEKFRKTKEGTREQEGQGSRTSQIFQAPEGLKESDIIEDITNPSGIWD